MLVVVTGVALLLYVQPPPGHGQLPEPGASASRARGLAWPGLSQAKPSKACGFQAKPSSVFQADNYRIRNQKTISLPLTYHPHYTEALSMTCITIIVPALQVSYEVDVTKDMLVRDLKAELEILTGLPIGANFHQSLEFRHIQAFD